MRVISYSQVVPAKNKSVEKEQILKKFVQGVITFGDTGILHTGNDILDCDVAVIQGWQHQQGKSSPHLKLREKVASHQIKNQKYVCIADSNLFLYATENNQPHHYLRYSFNGVFPSTGIYFDDNPDTSRWKKISKDLSIKIKDVRPTGSHILVCLQRQGGWSMEGTSVINWINSVVKQIRKHSDRPILIRPHPKDVNSKVYLRNLKLDKGINLSFNKSIYYDLNNAWCVVNHNSSSIVGPIINGYPAFITDPIKSQCSEVANTDFSNIENPKTFDRLKWLQRISMFHWNFSELEDGTAWAHMRNYVVQ